MNCNTIKVYFNGNGIEYKIGEIPSIIDFGKVLIGKSYNKDILIKNLCDIKYIILSLEFLFQYHFNHQLVYQNILEQIYHQIIVIQKLLY